MSMIYQDFEYHSLQLTDAENLESLAAGLGSLDILINNAGANLPWRSK